MKFTEVFVRQFQTNNANILGCNSIAVILKVIIQQPGNMFKIVSFHFRVLNVKDGEMASNNLSLYFLCVCKLALFRAQFLKDFAFASNDVLQISYMKCFKQL